VPQRQATFGGTDRKTVWPRAASLALCLMLFGAGESLAADGGGSTVGAALAPCATAPDGGVAVSFLPDENLFLAEDGSRYLAAELRFPDPPVDRSPPGLGDKSTQHEQLTAVALGPANRWDLVPAWIVASRKGEPFLWQAWMLEEGGAVFAPEHGTADCARMLRLAEGRARRAGKGHWRQDGAAKVYSTAQPETFGPAAGRYVIARGRIVSLGKTRSTRYLNFGNYWKTDVTAIVTSADEDLFDAALGGAGTTLDALAGRFVELRGMLELKDGPLIALRHPEQLVVLDGKRAGRDGQGNN